VPSTVPAVTEVTDTIDTTTVKLTATSVAEGGTVTYTATVGAPVTGSGRRDLANGQTITIEVGKDHRHRDHHRAERCADRPRAADQLDHRRHGGNYENLVADKTPVSTTVTDTVDTTNLSLSATGTVAEGGRSPTPRPPDQRRRLAGHRDLSMAP
jgi:surface adhesion protein